MTTPTLLPDAVLVARTFIAGHPAVVALGPRVGSRRPENSTGPVVVIRQIGSEAVRRQWLDRASLQIDAYAADQASASLLARTVSAVLAAAANEVTPVGVLVSADEETGLAWLPDTLLEPPAPRWLLGVSVLTHP